MNPQQIIDSISGIMEKLSTSYRNYPRYYQIGVPCILLFFVLVLYSCSPHLNATSLARVQNGMTSQQVTALIGQPSLTLTQGAVGLTATTYTYHYGSKDIKLVFLNDKLMAKESQL